MDAILKLFGCLYLGNEICKCVDSLNKPAKLTDVVLHDNPAIVQLEPAKDIMNYKTTLTSVPKLVGYGSAIAIYVYTEPD